MHITMRIYLTYSKFKTDMAYLNKDRMQKCLYLNVLHFNNAKRYDIINTLMII